MEKVKPYILSLAPEFKDYIWGGRKLIDEYKMDCPLQRLAEAWVLSCHKDGNSTVKNGVLAGETLQSAILKFDTDVMGENAKRFEYFPILIKLIDAKNNLSIQVHPDDDFAKKYENGYGKTEVWYVVDCDEGAGIYFGFKNEISKDEMAKRIGENTVTDVLNWVAAKKGDCFYIPSGTVHAIGKGMLIAEIQQNSNSTYRVYDYGRVGADGKPRELHVEKALQVAKLAPPEIVKNDDKNILADCKYFAAKRIQLCKNAEIYINEKSFAALLCVGGSGRINNNNQKVEFVAGDCMFVPSNSGKCEILGDGELILVTV